MYEVAGVVGVDPDGLSLRELFWMHRGRERAEWDRTAQACAVMVNLWGKRKVKPDVFNPFRTSVNRTSFKEFIRQMPTKKERESSG